MSNKEIMLKWGSLKGWENLSDEDMKFIERYYAEGVPMSAMTDKPDQHRKNVLCEFIDQFDGKIYLDWDGKYINKEQAKSYIIGYNFDYDTF